MSFRYPVFLNLEGKRCLVIGTGPEAESKSQGLRDAGALVHAMPDYVGGCLADFFLVIAATSDRDLNARIRTEADTLRILFNAVDDPAHCGFILPAVHRQGDLTVAVSSGGKSPAVAQRLRDWIAREAGPEYERLVSLLGSLRAEVASRYPDFGERRDLWNRIARSEALDLFREGRTEEAHALVRSFVEERASR